MSDRDIVIMQRDYESGKAACESGAECELNRSESYQSGYGCQYELEQKQGAKC